MITDQFITVSKFIIYRDMRIRKAIYEVIVNVLYKFNRKNQAKSKQKNDYYKLSFSLFLSEYKRRKKQ